METERVSQWTPMDPNDVLPIGNETSKNTALKEKRQTRMTVQARIKYRQRAIKKKLRTRLKNGTFPQRMKSIKPYPKMDSPESQAIVNAACNQVQCVILDQVLLEEEKKLAKDQERYQTLQQQQRKTCQKRVKSPTVAQLQKELAELHAKYGQVCKILENTRENYAEKRREDLKTPPCDTPVNSSEGNVVN